MDLKNKNLYEVKEIQGNLITVSPIDKEKKDENQRKVPKIEVLNPKKLKIRDGSIVRIALAKEIDFMEKIAALFFPVAAAFAGYIASPVILRTLKFAPDEKSNFFCILIPFVLATIIDFILTRKAKTIIKPVIVKLLEY